MRFLKAMTLVCCVLSVAACGKLAALADAITNADCDDFLQTEASATLAQQCQDITGYLDAESDSLSSLSQVLPTASLASSGTTFLQLTDAEGNPLTGVTADQVSVSVSQDGGQTFTEVEGETVSKLSEVETTQTAILANIDYSGSITDSDLEDVVSGMDTFLNALSVGYNGAVVKFSTDVNLAEDFTEDAAAITTAVNDTSYTREYTSLYDAIYDGVDYLKAQPQPLKLMILFTDGVDNDSTHTLTEAIGNAQENKIPVCVVGVTFADADLLQQIASDTGCFYIYKNFFTSLDDSFQAFAEQINNFEMVDLPDDFDAESGLLKVDVDAGEGSIREFTREF